MSLSSSTNSSTSYDDEETIGWIAAIIAALCYGSFGAAVKQTNKVPNVHPLVLQSYKTIVVFICCWFVMFFDDDGNNDNNIQWTPYHGILSGFLWVCGGTGGIYAIRNAGMSIAVGTWSSVMVMINFTVGILMFQEPIHNFINVCLAFSLLIIGLVGMSQYSSSPSSSSSSSPSSSPSKNKQKVIFDDDNDDEEEVLLVELIDSKDTENNGRMSSSTTTEIRRIGSNDDVKTIKNINSSNNNNRRSEDANNNNNDNNTDMVFFHQFGGFEIKRRTVGIMAAATNGLLAGSCLIPVHYAKQRGFGGIRYIVSFGCGSMIANTFIWLLYYIYYLSSSSTNSCCRRKRNNNNKPDTSSATTITSMPKWYLKELLIPGLVAGLLLAIGMYGSIIATSSLGQGVGNSLVQCKILISGLWGICYYKEVKSKSFIIKWFVSATISITGILWLSYEHRLGVAHRLHNYDQEDQLWLQDQHQEEEENHSS